MNSSITVRDVFETNNCAGKKTIHITSMEEDEIVKSRFRLTPVCMFPHDKLMLASVAPMDEVKVIVDHNPSTLLVGEYVDNLSDTHGRVATCLCGNRMLSDGCDVFCTNPHCALTITARIERLGKTVFFPVELVRFSDEDGHAEEGFWNSNSVTISDNPYAGQPFSPLLQPRLWGSNHSSLQDSLLEKSYGHISMATFLVEPLFREFIDYINTPLLNSNNAIFRNMSSFYGAMEELLQRRDYNSVRQNRFIGEFIWSLGIESLRVDHIQKLIEYEHQNENVYDVVLPYVFALTNPGELVNTLGVHPLEARAIISEVRYRKYELHDIFSHYSQNPTDVRLLFNAKL